MFKNFLSNAKPGISKSLFAKNPNLLARNKKAMTLLEIMIVLLIIGSIMGVLVPQVMGRLKGAKTKTAMIQLGEITKGIDFFYTDCGFYPDSLQDLVNEPSEGRKCKNWGPDPYLKNSLLNDPWGNEVSYTREGSSYTLKMLGQDGEEGGEGEDKDLSLDEE